MDFKQVEILLEIARCGTFSVAAKNLYVSQPTISVQMAALEKELGVRLFERQGRGYTLAPAGKRFLKWASDIIVQRDRALVAMQSFRTVVAGELNVWASSVPADYVLPKLLPEFLALYPQVFIQLFRSDSQEVWRRVTSYEAELGILGMLGGGDEVEAQPLMTDQVVLIASSTGRYSSWPEEIGYQEVLTEPFVLREVGSGTQKTFDDALKAKGCEPELLNVRARMQSVEAMKTAVAGGLGLGVVSALAVEEEVESGRLRCFIIKDLNLKRRFYLVNHRNKVLSPAAEMMKKYLMVQLKGGSENDLP